MVLGLLDRVGWWGLSPFAEKVLVGLPQTVVEILRGIIIWTTQGSLILILLKPVMQGVCDEL